MMNPAKYLAVVFSSLTLVACGGGGGGSDGSTAGAAVPVPVSVSASVFTLPAIPAPANSLASADFAKYEGVWRQDCVDHMRRTTALLATGANVFTVTPIEEFFAYADCTGDVVATGSYGGPQESVTYGAPLNATVTLTDLTLVSASINPATSTVSVAPYTFTGSGVKLVTNQGSRTFAHIVYADGFGDIVRDALDGRTTQGGLLFLNGELLALVPVAGSTTVFAVNKRFYR